MKITSCRFERAAYRLEDEPPASGPIVVFLGRSNVGKSSLINRLVGTKRLARTSSEPGRTQSVNFYRVNESFHFVDLPGYGYSTAPLRVRRVWRPMIEGFLKRRRDEIALAVLLVDARHEPSELDRVMQEWLVAGRVPFVVAATKADKLRGSACAAAAGALKEWMGERGEGPVLVSARTGLGVRGIWSRLDQALAAPTGPNRGKRWTSAS